MTDRDMYLDGFRDGWDSIKPRSAHPDYEDGHLDGDDEWMAREKWEAQRDDW